MTHEFTLPEQEPKRRSKAARDRGDFFSAFALVILLAMVTLLAMIPTDLMTQVVIVLSVYIGLAIASIWRDSRFAQLVFLSLVTLISLRYFIWRSTETLGLSDPISTVLMYLLYGAELFGFMLFLLSVFVNVKPRRRPPEEAPAAFDNLPTVDIFIPTYNEAIELVAVTVSAACQVDYPKNKVAVYVLDDGGTDAKLSQSDDASREAASKRASLLKGLCRRLGAHYMTREDNRHAKAGNINAAIKRTNGDVILILDADHIPTADILWRTVGYFQKDEQIGLVQTPHFMANPDPVEKNLDMFRSMPSENEMFFRQIQCGLDYWSASFFCGSAGLLRRTAIEEVGGFGTLTVTEDAETSIDLHANKWKSVYLDRPMITGLAPETLSGFIGQRVRWAQGMVQLFLLKNPLFRPGLRFGQRMGYLSSCLYWFFPLARIMFLIAPLAYLLFGRHIYNVSAEEFLAYTVPHFLASMIFANAMFHHVRWPFIGAIYELTQSIFAIRPLLATLKNPHKPSFKVTPKREHLENDFISPMALPFYILLFVVLLGFVGGFIRWQMVPDERDVILITMVWNTLNLFALLAVLGILLERRQLRSTPRLPSSLPASLSLADRTIDGELIDLSIGGACFIPYAPDE
ncbi:MAG: UDP-forming cellulose synthase catalytic subunit, partial [Pseudomonadota bacterium]